jgi:hypothetical protein
MSTSISRKIVLGHCVALRRWFVPMLVCAACMLEGCDNRPAPSPTPNPHPQRTLRLKITVEKGSEVNRVEVKSLWVVTNLGCAPVSWPAGNERVKQVDASEKVEKTANDQYVATIVLDRFSPGECGWVNSGPDVKFFHNSYLLSTDALNSGVLHGQRPDAVTCLTRPFVEVGVCASGEERYYKHEDKHAFNAFVEMMK